MAIPKIVADFEVQLSTAISIGGTSFTLSSNVDDDGNTIPDGLYYFTVDNGTSAKEYLAGTLSGTSVTGVVSVNRQGTETSGAARAHRVGASVIITDFATYKKFMEEASIAGASDASSSSKGIVEVATSAEIDADDGTGSTGAPAAITADQLILSKYGTQLTSYLALVASMSGMVVPYAGRSAPTGWLLCDGSAVSRATYATLFGVLSPSQTFTVTIASPGVFTATAHGLVVGDRIHMTTTGGLPSGLATNTDYYIISSGLTTDAFQVALSPGGTAVVTTGSQSGTHTLYKANFGRGDGSTTFNLPDLRSRVPIGKAAAAPTVSMVFESAAVNTTNNTVTVTDAYFPAQNQLVRLTTSDTLPTGLAISTDYYVIRTDDSTIKFASSLANAVAGTAIDITGAGTGVHTIVFTGDTHTVLARAGGESKHVLSVGELAIHSHVANMQTGTGGNWDAGEGVADDAANTGDQGSNTPHNNMQPYVVLNYIIKT